MATDIRIPKLGFSMESGILAEWLVEDGSEVTAGQEIYALENEKSTQEVESPATGKLKIIVQADGEEYPVGELIGTIE
ncbi:MAG: dihydrolipoamide acyltransferase [Sphingopyxis sp.]|nr:MAG: dihydrolipoamide acyltransferase [Sphingopyxis sp.]